MNCPCGEDHRNTALSEITSFDVVAGVFFVLVFLGSAGYATWRLLVELLR